MDMRCRGYSFDDPTQAERVKALVVNNLGLEPEDAKVADLAEDGFVLGVRVPDEIASDVDRIVTGHGARPLADIDERWTLPRPSNRAK
jgi:hypothetical protein